MSELIAVLVPLLAVDALNPVLFAALLVATSTARPVLNGSALLAGHTAAYFAAGIGIAVALEAVANRLANPQPVDYVLGLLVGLACLYAAFGSRKGGASEGRSADTDLGAWGYFGFGAVVNFVGVPFAVPYFAAIDQLLRADLSLGESLAVLALYNLAYAAPFALVPALIATLGEKCRPALQRINALLIKVTDTLMPLLLALIGLALLVDATLYFARGRGLY